MRTLSLVGIICLLLGACAEYRGHQQTVTRGLHIQDLYRKQILANLSRAIDNPNSIPSMTEIVQGTVQAQTNVTPKLTVIPLGNTVVENGVGLVTSRSKSGMGAALDYSENLQHVWNMQPVTGVNKLRTLRDMYRTAVLGYAAPNATVPNQKLVLLPWQKKFIYSRQQIRDNMAVHSLGVYGDNELLMSLDDYESGVLEEFILAIMHVADKNAGSAALFVSGGIPTALPQAGPVYPSLQ